MCAPLVDIDFFLDLATVTLKLKRCQGYISETVGCKKVIPGKDIGY